jgi:tetratricopeptide (TPR) repeat protein
MNEAYHRGIMFFGQNQFARALAEFRRGLAEDPDDAMSHAHLALCLVKGGQNDEALHEADEAVRLEPDDAFAHYTRGHVLNHLDRYKEAEAAAIEATRLEPEDADYRCLLASVAMGRRRWAEALEAADLGLALDPEHLGCVNLRAMALVQLGRNDEATQTLGSALADDPEDALSHANQGWALLHQGDHARALEHFRESLRLDPESEWARAGIIESLKARHLIYRIMLRFFLWIGRQGQVAQWAVILGFIFGRKLLAEIADSAPALKPFITPILALGFGFLLLTWIASPLFNFLLQFNRFGRLALTREEKVAANVIGVCFSLAVGSFVVYSATGALPAEFAMILFGFLLLPLTVTFGQPRGNPRRLMAVYSVALVLLCVPLCGLLILGPASPFGGPAQALQLYQCFLYGAIFSTWIPALLGLRNVAR